MDLIFDAIQPPTVVTTPISLLYSIVVLAFVVVSLVSAFKIIFKGFPTAH